MARPWQKAPRIAQLLARLAPHTRASTSEMRKPLHRAAPGTALFGSLSSLLSRPFALLIVPSQLHLLRLHSIPSRPSTLSSIAILLLLLLFRFIRTRPAQRRRRRHRTVARTLSMPSHARYF